MVGDDPRAALAALADRSGTSLSALSRMIGRNAAYLQQFIVRGSPRRLDERDRQTLARFFGIDEALLGGAPVAGSSAIAVPRLDVRASAGAGALVDAEPRLSSLGLDPALLARLSVRPHDLSLIRAQGESMVPTILDGDELLVDRGNRRVPAAGAVFVVRHDDTMLVKRVMRRSGGHRLISDNPAYPIIETDDLDLIGRVVWLSRAV